MFVELHILQNFAPSCLNRDDTNSPKGCDFGGVRRARISSQCIKRAIRRAPIFTETTKAENGERTKRLAKELTDRLGKEQDPGDVARVLEAVVPAVFTKLDGEGRTDVALYLAPAEVAEVESEIQDLWKELKAAKPDAAIEKLKKALQKVFKKGDKGVTSAPDVAMFGRMLASEKGLDIHMDAACQVAHAVSTHRVGIEFDFFTAVDDLQPREETGAGMMGTVEFNSACFYRYANVDLGQLATNLGGDKDLARRTVEAFLRASVLAIPTGKQNSMAAQNPPDYVLAVVRKSGLWSLANAFVKPVFPGQCGDLVARSVAALEGYWARLEKAYGGDALVDKAAFCLVDAESEALGKDGAEIPREGNLEGLVKRVMGKICY